MSQDAEYIEIERLRDRIIPLLYDGNRNHGMNSVDVLRALFSAAVVPLATLEMNISDAVFLAQLVNEAIAAAPKLRAQMLREGKIVAEHAEQGGRLN